MRTMTIAVGRDSAPAEKLAAILEQALSALSWQIQPQSAGWTRLVEELGLAEADLYLGRGELMELPAELDYYYLPPAYARLLENRDGAGRYFLLFRRRDEVCRLIRNYFLPPLLFVGSGIGGADNLTLAAGRALENCEVCIYDSLIPDGVLELLPAGCEKIFVGKRNRRHSLKQPQINDLLCEQARSGRRVVRLKGGDPAVFGRLAEEVAALGGAGLAFRVLPGVSAFNVAAASTGFLPTRRDCNRGFCVATPRRAGSHSFAPLNESEKRQLQTIYYMAATQVAELVEQYRADGFAADWPIAMVFDAGSWRETVICGTLKDIVGKLDQEVLRGRPALVIIGPGAAADFRFPALQPLSGKAVLCRGRLAAAAAVVEQVENLGGRACRQPSTAALPVDDDFAAYIFTESADLLKFLEGPQGDDRHGRVVCCLESAIPAVSWAACAKQPHILMAADPAAAVDQLALYYLNREITRYLRSGSWTTSAGN